ncbi:hypothetical protein PspLS_09813 [Pyricularia sp. CBS 133598]|nr:hypothetical protein PspLS_09813 [Pyricularia sp. CBS 133598]
MQLSFSAVVMLLAFGVNQATADQHHDLVCVNTYTDNNSGRNIEATKCACEWLKSHDKCGDCVMFEGRACHSDGKHLDGDQFSSACTEKCSRFGASGSSIV